MNDVRALSGLRWRGDAGHAESWSLFVREPSGRRGLWVRHVLASPAARGRGPRVPAVAELVAVAFDREDGHVAVKTTVPLERARFAARGVDVEVDGAHLDARRSRGSAETGGRALAWDLAIGDATAEPVVPLPRALYATPVPAAKRITPVVDARASGEVRVVRGAGAAEERWDVTGWSVVLGHDWGRARPEVFAWSHASAWDVEGLVVEAVATRARVGPLRPPLVAGVFVRFRGLRFDLGGLAGLRGTTAWASSRRLEVEGRSETVSVRYEAYAETDELVGLHHTEPSGETRALLGTAVGQARVELVVPGRTITARAASASLVLLTREADHGVRMYA